MYMCSIGWTSFEKLHVLDQGQPNSRTNLSDTTKKCEINVTQSSTIFVLYIYFTLKAGNNGHTVLS